MKSFRDKLNELPDDRKNKILQTGEELILELKDTVFDKDQSDAQLEYYKKLLFAKDGRSLE